MALAVTLSLPAFAQEITGRVVGVADGDTVTVLVLDGEKKTPVKIRLNGIDCPESDQPFGQAAKQFTSKAVYGKTVTVRTKEKDRYGRTVGDVIAPDPATGEPTYNLNQALVRNGWAWWYRKYAPDDATLKQLEFEAREKKIGLWAETKTAVASWDWRKGTRPDAARPPNISAAAATAKPAPRFLSASVSPSAGPIQVWVNTKSGVYHYPGMRWYGATKQGMYMSEKDAQAQGYRPTRNGQ